MFYPKTTFLRRTIIPFLLSLPLLTVVGCFGDNDPLFTPAERSLPAITTEGLNTFGCYIDGELFGPLDSPGFAQDPIDAWYTPYAAGGFQVICTEYNSNSDVRKSINLLSFFFEEGVQELSFHEGIYLNYNSPSGILDYRLDTVSPHLIEIINIDIEQAIVSGTFYFTAIAEDYSDTIQVTDGRFDVIVTY